jgi:hypothetical protein
MKTQTAMPLPEFVSGSLMPTAKDILIKPIKASDANRLCKVWHYSGKVVPNSQLHFGVWYKGHCEGVMQFGPSINKKGTINLVKGTGWNGFIELNRMAFSDKLPKNSESRAIGVCMRLIKKNYPHIDWVISFADATQCGDGAIYRASGFKLVGIAENTSLRINPKTGEKIHIIQAHHLKISKEFRAWQPLKGYQLKYIYFINKNVEQNLTLPIIPFSKIGELGIGMYKGAKVDRL